MIPPEHLTLLTPVQAAVATLHDIGWGTRAISLYLAIPRPEVRDILNTAATTIAKETAAHE